MKSFCTILYQKMLKELDDVESNAENSVQRCERSYTVSEQALRELKQFILDYQFRDISEEIEFFKEMKPMFQRELIYFQKLFYFEMNMPVSSKEAIHYYHTHTLHGISNFFEHNKTLYTYYRIGNSENDEQYFTRKIMVPYCMPEYNLDLDSRFSTVFSVKLAKIQAFEMLKDYVNLSITSLETGEYYKKSGTQINNLKWTDKKAGLIELLLAIHAHQAVNAGKVSFAKLVDTFEKVFNVSLGNVYRAVQNMRIRKKDRTPYLKSLIESTEKYMDNADLFSS